MNISEIVEALKATLTGDRKDVVDYLKLNSKVIGFPQILLELTNNDQVEYEVRQAAVIYLKNLIQSNWEIDKEAHVDGNTNNFELSEHDKTPIRQKLMDYILNAAGPIQVHLCSCIQSILRADFPERWWTFVEELGTLLQNTNGHQLYCSLLILYRFCKVYEYKSSKDRASFDLTMKQLYPVLKHRFEQLIPDNSQESCQLQHLILKIFFCQTQFSLDMEVISAPEYGNWSHYFIAILDRPVPDLPNMDSPEETAWWKCKKWVLKTIARIFERFACKGQVEQKYAEFAEYYSKNNAVEVIKCLIRTVLVRYMEKQFVPDNVIYLTISHIADAISQAQLWLVVRDYHDDLLKKIIFQLLMHSNLDELTWQEDPEEYLRVKYDVIDIIGTPCSAASQLLQAMARRVGIMLPILQFILGILTSPRSSPHEVDGALNMIGVLAPSLIKKKKYKKDVEKLIDAHVIPRISSEYRFVRARACFAAKQSSSAQFNDPKIIKALVNALVERLKVDTELPVKVEAATAIQALLSDQEQKVMGLIKPYVRDILIEVMRLINSTQIEELPAVVDVLIESFEEDVIPIAYDLAVELVGVFNKLAGIGRDDDEFEESDQDNTITMMGLLATMEVILCLVEENKEIVEKIEPVIHSCINNIFKHYCANFFEEGLSLTQTLIAKTISPNMWSLYEVIYNAYMDEGTHFFSDCMPCLYSYLTVDTPAFMSEPNRLVLMLEMCRKTLQDPDAGEESHLYAAKLFEVLLLHCQGQVDHCLQVILQLCLTSYGTLSEEMGLKDELRSQLLVVFIAAFYSNSHLFLNLLPTLQPTISFNWLLSEVFNHRKCFGGMHDRKMIIYLMCKVVSSMPFTELPHGEMTETPNKILEFFITHLDDLQKCIKMVAENKADSDESDEDSSTDDDREDRMDDDLKDSDDDVDEGTLEYLESLKRKRGKGDEDGDEDSESAVDSEDYDHFIEESHVESYETPIDAEEGGLNVFLLFKQTLQQAEKSNPQFYHAIFNGLSEEKYQEFQKLLTVCTQQENLEHSKQVAQAGGYTFDAAPVNPSNFKFS